MIGKSRIREQGMQDALLCGALRDREMDDIPLWQREFLVEQCTGADNES